MNHLYESLMELKDKTAASELSVTVDEDGFHVQATHGDRSSTYSRAHGEVFIELDKFAREACVWLMGGQAPHEKNSV